MKRIAPFLLVFLAASVRAEESTLREYLWRQAIHGEIASGQLYRVHVDGQILDGASAFPADVRVVGAGQYWPFFLWAPTNDVMEVPLKSVPAPAGEEQKVGVQSLYFDLGVRHLPLRSIRLSASETNYVRPVKVFGRNAETNSWRWAGDGGIHRTEEQVREEVRLRGCEYRWLKIELYHYEEPPLTITNAVADQPRQYLVFEAAGDSQPYVYYSLRKITLPHYDLRKRTTDEAITNAMLLDLGRRRMNPERIAMSLGRYGHWLIVATLVIVAVLVAIFGIKFFQRRALS